MDKLDRERDCMQAENVIQDENVPVENAQRSERLQPDNRRIRFSLDAADIDFDQLLELFRRNAFWASDRCRDDLERAVAHSHPVVTVWDGDRLIGFARATSDGVYRAVLWDVVIDGDYRKQGLGRKLVETLIAHPDMQRVERVYLFTTYQQDFYRRIGFEENTSSTMVLMGQTLEFIPPEGMESSPRMESPLE
ncbi:MAG: GNAT family N-acetyltransferase [Cyanobacteria bacterium J06642_12]